MTASTAAGVLHDAPAIDRPHPAPAPSVAPTAPPRRTARPRRRLRIARAAVVALFFLDGFGMASWVVRIPAVQRALDLSAGRLGLALLGTAVGGLLAMPLVGMLVARLGSRPVARWSALAFTGALVLPPLAGSL